MTTIDSLPAKSLHRILELAEEGGGRTALERSAILGTLSAASLVARNWREPAQAHMWKSLLVLDNARGRRMLPSPRCGTFRTVGARLFDLEDDTANALLGHLKGVRSLVIRTKWLSDPQWMNLPSLADLESLYWIEASVCDTSPANLPPAFRLRKLQLLGGSGALPAVIDSLFTTSTKKKPLLSLSLNHLDPTAYSAVLSALPILTNTLTTLTFLGTFPPTTPESVTSLSTLASLNHLVLQTYNVAHLRDVDALLRALTPCQPLAFSLRCNDSTHGRELLPALVPMVQTRACERLKSLTVHLEYMRSEEELWEWPNGAVFRDLCKTRGICVTFSRPSA